MKKLILYILVLILRVYNVVAQPEPPVSVSGLVDKYYAAGTETEKMNYCLQIAQLSVNNDTIMQFAQKAQILAEKLSENAVVAECQIIMGKIYFIKHDYESAIQIIGKALEIANIYFLSEIEAEAYFELANCYNMKNDQRAALIHYKKALEIYTELDKPLHIAGIFRQIGANCYAIGFYEEARKNFNVALYLDVQHGDNLAKALDYAYIANLLAPNFDEEVEDLNVDSLRKAQQYADSIPGLLKGTRKSVSVNTAYNIYYMTKTMLSLVKYKRSGLKMREYLFDADRFNNEFYRTSENLGNYEQRIFSDILKAEIHLFKGELDKAVTKIEHLKEKQDIKWLKNTALVYKTAAEIYASSGNFEKAYKDYNTYVKYKNRYMDVTSKNADFRSDFSISKEISKLNAEKMEAITMQENKVKIIGRILAGTIAAVLLFTFLWRRSSKNERILSETNSRLSQQQQEILAQRNVIDQQRAAVERANVEIYQSINYAKHIQQAALPGEDTIKSFFPDSFVYYVPKDIVSGDFYYVTQNSGYNIFVLADCTGHGVPGGFLSMLGISAVKDLLKNPEIDILPGILLDMMRDYIKSALSNDEFYLNSLNAEEDEESYATADGMDMSVCAIDVYNHKLRFAGAYQSAYIVREGEIIRMKGDRMPVGRHINEKPNFTTMYFDTMPGDMVYMQSDGIESQIGFTGQKFMTKRLKQFFLDNYQKPCQEQKETITKIMDDWIFGSVQVDDLSMAGIRIS
jgi:serine phosphatase RsbU (regulator of sigma subunit)/Tfp pilus assembly protein PilF